MPLAGTAWRCVARKRCGMRAVHSQGYVIQTIRVPARRKGRNNDRAMDRAWDDVPGPAALNRSETFCRSSRKHTGCPSRQVTHDRTLLLELRFTCMSAQIRLKQTRVGFRYFVYILNHEARKGRDSSSQNSLVTVVLNYSVVHARVCVYVRVCVRVPLVMPRNFHAGFDSDPRQ